MTERTPGAEREGRKQLIAALDRLQENRIPTGPPYISPLERRVIALEAVVSQLLELPGRGYRDAGG